MSKEYTANAIIEARIAKGLNQTELAKLCDVTRATVSKWEKGKSFPRIHQFDLLERALGVDKNILLAPDKTKTKPGLDVVGVAAKGVWNSKEALENTYKSSILKHSQYPKHAQYCLEIGDSHASKIASKGDILHCVDFALAGLKPVTENIVVIEKRQGDLVENSLYGVISQRGSLYLTQLAKERFEEPIAVTKDTVIKAKVIGCYKIFS